MSDLLVTEPRVVHGVDLDTAEEAWKLYAAAFAGLETVAADAHSLPKDWVLRLLQDPRVESHVARADDGTLAGHAAITNDLTLIPWIYPTFYRHRFPEAAAEGRLYYVAFYCVAPAFQRQGVLLGLTRSMARSVAERRAVVGFDVCAFNDAQLSLTEVMSKEAARMGVEHDVAVADVQRYYVATFDGTAASSGVTTSAGNGLA